MSPQEQQALKVLFNRTAAYFDQLIPDEVLRLYVEDLNDLEFLKVASAMRDLRRDPSCKRCPLPSQIRARLMPESNPESEALMVVGRITEAVARIGPYRSAEAKEAIGPVGWQLVQLEGGWEHLCSATTEQMGMLKAQWRNLARALIERGAGVAKAPAIEHKPADSDAAGLAMLNSILKKLPIKEGA